MIGTINITIQTLVLIASYCSLILISIVSLVEMILVYRKPVLLKLLFLTGHVSFILKLIGFLLILTVNSNHVLYNFSSFILGCTAIFTLALIYTGKIRKVILFIPIMILGIWLLFLYYYQIMHMSNFAQFNSSYVFIMRLFIKVFMLYLTFNLSSQFKTKSFYVIKLKSWFNIISGFLIVSITLSILQEFFKNLYAMETIMQVINDLAVVLVTMFRPAILNNTQTKIAVWGTITMKNAELVSEVNFNNAFFFYQYYLKKDANLETLAIELKVDKDLLSQYIIDNYKSSFVDLLNKNRIIYFKDLIFKQTFQKYTLETLGSMSGFNSRQALYNSFKKFEGGTPSDLIKALA